MSVVTIYTDGACRGNPGPGGWGVVMERDSHITELMGGELQTTNNRMELKAAIEGLTAVTNGDEVHIYTDSKYVRDGITAWIAKWQINGWRTAQNLDVKNKDLWVQLTEVNSKLTITWHWVKGHSGHPQNERADFLARNGLLKQLMVG